MYGMLAFAATWAKLNGQYGHLVEMHRYAPNDHVNRCDHSVQFLQNASV
jgi:hypothetical protein